MYFLLAVHEWDPCVLDYTHPHSDGDPAWAPDPSGHEQHDLCIQHILIPF